MQLKTLLILTFPFVFINSAFAQTIFYKTTDGILMTEENYHQIKKEMNEREDLAGQYQEIPIKAENRNDTIIKTIKFEKIMMATGENKKMYDPYVEQRKLIGSHFPIELFKGETGSNFSPDHLKGKPSVVNFWFTSCPPCIEEIPDLHKLKKEFGDSVNFIAVTFDSTKKVNKFLEKSPFFDFIHVTDAQKPIDKLKIESYPMSFLLNKEGEIVNIYGGLMFSQTESLKQLLSLLL